jgi:hypothetical protein
MTHNAQKPAPETLSPPTLAIVASIEAIRAQMRSIDAQLDALVAVVSSSQYAHGAIARAVADLRAERKSTTASGLQMPAVFGSHPSRHSPNEDRNDGHNEADALGRLDVDDSPDGDADADGR